MKRKPTISIIYPEKYPNETVEEIIEHCRQAYYRLGCDKFPDFKKEEVTP
jgi:hypothetical protein